MWKVLRLTAILGWLFGAIGGLGFGYPPARLVLIVMAVVHPVEVPYGIYLARRSGRPAGRAAWRTLLYGFVYWVPEILLAEESRRPG